MNATDQPYMLDTTEFNYLLDGKITASSFAGRRLLVTGIQVAELRATKNASRRECLLAVSSKLVLRWNWRRASLLTLRVRAGTKLIGTTGAELSKECLNGFRSWILPAKTRVTSGETF